MVCGISVKSKGNVWLRLLELRLLALSAQQQMEWKEEEVLRESSTVESHAVAITYLSCYISPFSYLLINFKELINSQ